MGEFSVFSLNCIDDQAFFVQTKKVVMDILEGKHFQFHEFEIDEHNIHKFWTWFIENEEDLRNRFMNKDNEYIINNITEQLQKVFIFLEKEVAFGILIDKDQYQLEFCDNYAVAIHKGLEKLVDQSPNLENWKFKIVH